MTGWPQVECFLEISDRNVDVPAMSDLIEASQEGIGQIIEAGGAIWVTWWRQVVCVSVVPDRIAKVLAISALFEAGVERAA